MADGDFGSGSLGESFGNGSFESYVPNPFGGLGDGGMGAGGMGGFGGTGYEDPSFAGLGFDFGALDGNEFGLGDGINPLAGGYSGYTTGQWGDPSSPNYDPNYSGGRSFGDSIQETLKRLLLGLGKGMLGRRIGPAAGPLVAGAMAPEGQRMQAAGRAFAGQTVNGLLAGIPVVGPLNALSGMLGGPSLGGLIGGMAPGTPGQGYGDSTGRGGPAGGMNGYGAALSILSGLDAMRSARNMSESMAPFDRYRSGFAARAAGLEADPKQLLNSPGYRAGLQAVQRAMAAQGYTGSGNAAVRIAEFGNDFFNRESDRLARLGGAGAAPGAGAIPASILRGQGLASMAYGLTPLFDYFSQEWGG